MSHSQKLALTIDVLFKMVHVINNNFLYTYDKIKS